MGAQIAGHLKEVLDHCKLTDDHLLGISTDDSSPNYSMSRKLPTISEASGIEWPALTNHIPLMAHIIQLAFGAFNCSLNVTGRTKSWEAHQRDQHYGENERTEIGTSQRFRKEGYGGINKVSAMKPSLAKIIEKVHIS